MLCINITIVNDDIPESLEVFTVVLRLLTPLTVASINTSVTIIDDDQIGNGEVCMIWQPCIYRQVMAVLSIVHKRQLYCR